jgi:hypothetical protein
LRRGTPHGRTGVPTKQEKRRTVALPSTLYSYSVRNIDAALPKLTPQNLRRFAQLSVARKAH